MKWQDCAIQDLKKYEGQRESLENIRERIQVLRLRYETVKTVCTDKEAVKGGASGREDAMLDNIVERERLKLTYRANKKLVELIDKGMACLNEKEVTVLEAFYIYKRKDHIDYLQQQLGYERSQVYRIKEDALYKFTIAMYGVLEF